MSEMDLHASLIQDLETAERAIKTREPGALRRAFYLRAAIRDLAQPPAPVMPTLPPRSRAKRRTPRPAVDTPAGAAKAFLAALACELGAAQGNGFVGDDELVLDGHVVAYRRGADVRIHAVFAPSGAGIRTAIDGRWVGGQDTFAAVVADIRARQAERAQYAAEFAKRAAERSVSREP